MTRHFRFIALVILFSIVQQGQAQEWQSLTRDEVSVLKKRLVSALEALGQPPAGYGIDKESFNLPAEVCKQEKGGGYNPIVSGVTREYGSEKATEEASKDFQKEYEKKMLEAQASGDYEAVAKLSQEISQKASSIQLKAAQGRKEPIAVSLSFNTSAGDVIDPDGVVFEKPGVIALWAATNQSTPKGAIRVYFDPVSLKDTKQLSRVNMNLPVNGVSKRTTILNAAIQLTGPSAELDAWAKRIDVKKVLALIDAAK